MTRVTFEPFLSLDRRVSSPSSLYGLAAAPGTPGVLCGASWECVLAAAKFGAMHVNARRRAGMVRLGPHTALRLLLDGLYVGVMCPVVEQSDGQTAGVA